MNEDEALRLLRGGKNGVRKWNRLREKGADIPYFFRARLAGVDLRGADLTGLHFWRADLSFADLRRANLSGLDFRGVDLSAANLSRANLSGVDLSGAKLSGVDLIGANLSGANLSAVDLSGHDLSYANLSRVDLTGLHFWRADLSGANLRGADLTGVHFWGAGLSLVDLSGRDLRGVKLSGANLSGADLRGADLRGVNLSGANLSEADLSGADLRGANLCRVDLSRVGLSGANLHRAGLSGFDLRGVDLREVNLTGANLRGANLSGADLRGANLREANLRGADLSTAKLNGGNLRTADLSGTDLIGADFTGADLSGANLIGAHLSGADLSANLTRANLCSAKLTPEGRVEGYGSFLDLSTCEGIESADFADSGFLQDYIARAFQYAHDPTTEDAKRWPDFVARALERIKALRALLEGDEPPAGLVEVVHEISAELIKYLAAHPKALYEIKPRQFEELIAEILASYGWEVQLTPASKDGGYDLFAFSRVKGDVRTSWIIECKKWAPERKVGVDIVRALFGVKGQFLVANAMLATTSHFTRGALALKASRYDLELRDYEGILDWINQYRPNPDGKLYIKDNKLVLPGED